MHITAKYFDNVYDLEVEPTDSLLSLKKKISVGNVHEHSWYSL